MIHDFWFLLQCVKGAQEASKTRKDGFIWSRAFVAFTKHEESLIIKREMVLCYAREIDANEFQAFLAHWLFQQLAHCFSLETIETSILKALFF